MFSHRGCSKFSDTKIKTSYNNPQGIFYRNVPEELVIFCVKSLFLRKFLYHLSIKNLILSQTQIWITYLKAAMDKNTLNKSNVFKLLKNLSKSEFNEFDKFVHSALLNNRSEVTAFFDRIKKYYPSFDHAEFTKKKIYDSLFPDSGYRDDVIRRLCSNLFKLAEDYLSYSFFRSDKFNQHKNLLEQYRRRDLNDFYKKQFYRTGLFLKENKLRNAEYFLRTAQIEEINRQHITKRDTTAMLTDVQIQIDSIWKFTLIKLLRLYAVAVQHVNQFNKKYDLSNLTLLLDLIDRSDFKNEKTVELYYLTTKIMTDLKNDKTFYRLKHLHKENHNILDNSENDIIFVALLTYCWDMNVKPGNDYSKDEFELILEMINKGILTEDGKIYSEWFMYAFLTAIKANEIVFAEKFLEKYKDLIPENERFNVVNHASAELELIKKNYEKALEYLNIPKYNNVSEKLRANNMYLRIYYELGRSDQFFYQIDSFKHLLKNVRSLSSNLIKVRQNFVKYIYILYKNKLGEMKTDLSVLKIEINNSQLLYSKWIMKKLDELENSGSN